MKSAYVILMCVLSTLLACAPRPGQAIPPPQCNPAIIDEIPLNIRNMCAKLATIYELSGAMESYLNEKAYQGNNPLLDRIDGGVKRQDVDHVFLRFGRRR